MKNKTKKIQLVISSTIFTLVLAFLVIAGTISDQGATLPPTNFTGNVNIDGDLTTDDLISKGPWVDVRAFGAVGDGVTDDTAAIQAAFDGVGLNIFFPEGTYLISDTLIINKPSIVINGQGPKNTIIKMKSGSNKDMIHLDVDTNQEYFSMFNIRLLGAYPTDTLGSGIVGGVGSANMRDLHIEETSLYNFPEWAIDLDDGWGLLLRNNVIEHGNNGVRMKSGYDAKIYYNKIADMEGYGIYVGGSSGGTKIVSNYLGGGTNKPAVAVYGVYTLISNNFFQNIMSSDFNTFALISGNYTQIISNIFDVDSTVPTALNITNNATSTDIFNNNFGPTTYPIIDSGLRTFFTGRVSRSSNKYYVNLNNLSEYVFFNDGVVSDASDGSSVYIYRNAAEGKNYLKFRVNSVQTAEISSDTTLGLFSTSKNIELQRTGKGNVTLFSATTAGTINNLFINGWITAASTRKYAKMFVDDTDDKFVIAPQDSNIKGLRVNMPLQVGDGTLQTNITLTSPNANEWCCGVSDAGTFSCTAGACV